MSRFERIDNTAPVTDVSENIDADVKYSNFDESFKKIGQALPFAIIPIHRIRTVPNTTVWLNYDVMITFRNPSVRKMLNGWRVYIHSYYNRNSDLWEGWNNFITKGRSGKMTLKIPHLQTRITGKDGKVYSPFTPMSLYDYLEYAPEQIKKYGIEIGGETTYIPDFRKNSIGRMAELTTTDGETDNPNTHESTGLADYENIEINAMDAVMYQKLWRDKYSNKNLLQSNEKLFPPNEDHFILSYNADEVGKIDYENEEITATETNDPNHVDEIVGIDNETPGDKEVRIDILRYRQFQGDRFTTASPFNEMIRGDAPEMNLNIDGSDLVAELNDKSFNETNTEIMMKPRSSGTFPANTSYMLINEEATSDKDPTKVNAYYNSGTGTAFINDLYYKIKDDKTIQIGISGTAITSSISLSDLRSLEVFTIFSERMGRTNGDYNEMIKAQFNHNPKSDTREAIYIGGSYQDIVSNSIYQTSASTNESPLGTQVAQGISSSYNKIGEFTADDYGIIMTVMCIVPETIYVNGIDRKDTALTMEEQYFPIMNNLSAEAILNQELYVSGNETDDKDAWGWAERFSEWKSRQNKVVGLSQLSSTQSAYDSALVMARRFNETPNLNARFVTGVPENYSLDCFTSEDEAPFDFAIRADCNIKYPMPYVTIPGGLGTRA